MPLARLLTLSVVMLASTLAASFLPTYLALSPKRLAIISLFGTGLLIGAALAIVIPEGVAALYENAPASDQLEGEDSHRMPEMSSYVGAALLAGFVAMYLIDSLHSHHAPPPEAEYGAPKSRRGSAIQALHRSYSAELTPLAQYDMSHESLWHDEAGRIGGGGSKSGSPTSSPFEGGDDHSKASKSPRRLNHTSSAATLLVVPTIQSQSLSVVVGLLAHSLADGISLGASSLSYKVSTPSTTSSLDLLVFTAIMLHKAPTALALASILLSDPTSSTLFIRYSLLAFSFASPIGSVLTYAILSVLGRGAEQRGGEGWWAGLALCFSGGTFLFVATHVMKITGSHDRHTHSRDGEGDEVTGGGVHNERISQGAQTAIVMIGMIMPLFLSKLVGHGH